MIFSSRNSSRPLRIGRNLTSELIGWTVLSPSTFIRQGTRVNQGWQAWKRSCHPESREQAGTMRGLRLGSGVRRMQDPAGPDRAAHFREVGGILRRIGIEHDEVGG